MWCSYVARRRRSGAATGSERVLHRHTEHGNRGTCWGEDTCALSAVLLAGKNDPRQRVSAIRLVKKLLIPGEPHVQFLTSFRPKSGKKKIIENLFKRNLLN